MKVGLISDHVAHLGYDRPSAHDRLARAAASAEHEAQVLRTVRPSAPRPRIAYRPVHFHELPPFVLARAADKGLDLLA